MVISENRIGIIGGGPAGLSAALQLGRYQLNPILFEQKNLGGLLLNANKVDNYLGFPEGLRGQELVKKCVDQVKNYNVDIKFDRILKLDYLKDEDLFLAESENGGYSFEWMVVASGTVPRTNQLFLSFSRKFPDRVLFEILSLLDHKDRKICIVGAGDMAFDFALQLSRENRVTLLNRGEIIKAIKPLRDDVLGQKNISYLPNMSVENVRIGDRGDLILELKNPDGLSDMDTDFLAVAIGRMPERCFLSENLKQYELELIQRKKIHFVGDVKNGRYRQAAIAIGDGLLAAMKIYDKMMEKKNEDFV